VTLERAEQFLAEKLSDKALAHSKHVAETAALLATLYGVDAEKARLAGLLHDWHRELDGEALVNAAEDAGIDVADDELRVPYLLHARTGAADLSSVMPELPADVLDAVARHTIGSADMTDLDKVVYVADMIEPGRDYPGVDDLREAAGTVSLADLFAEAYRQSVAHLVDSRKRIHPTTVDVWNALVARSER
jgi:predicted HD superfamily hydrolase involved in NAD metabolism